MTTPVGIIFARTRALSCRHRIAHLRALLRRQPVGSLHGEQLAALLRAEVTARPSDEDRAT
jgi:hypothetical protein